MADHGRHTLGCLLISGSLLIAAASSRHPSRQITTRRTIVSPTCTPLSRCTAREDFSPQPLSAAVLQLALPLRRRARLGSPLNASLLLFIRRCSSRFHFSRRAEVGSVTRLSTKPLAQINMVSGLACDPGGRRWASRISKKKLHHDDHHLRGLHLALSMRSSLVRCRAVPDRARIPCDNVRSCPQFDRSRPELYTIAKGPDPLLCAAVLGVRPTDVILSCRLCSCRSAATFSRKPLSLSVAVTRDPYRLLGSACGASHVPGAWARRGRGFTHDMLIATDRREDLTAATMWGGQIRFTWR